MTGIEEFPATMRGKVAAITLTEYFTGGKVEEPAHLTVTTLTGKGYDFEFLPGEMQTVRYGGTKYWLRPAHAHSVTDGVEGGFIGFNPDSRTLLIVKRDDDGSLVPVQQSSSVGTIEVLSA